MKNIVIDVADSIKQNGRVINYYHTCAPSKCPHCSDVLIDEGHHGCYIQPLKPDEHSYKYIYFDFETMHENGKHTANYLCAISQKGELFTAEGVGCVDQINKHVRRPKFADFTFIAHNASGFDSYILLEYFTSQGLAPNLYSKDAHSYKMSLHPSAQRK